MDVDLAAAGFGLDYGALCLERTTSDQVAIGTRLRDAVEAVLGSAVAGVEQIGSSSVSDLLAKPIVDLAVGLGENDAERTVRTVLVAAGWIYRGDAGGSGGHVFVLETRPWHRVAHLHVVELGGDQWQNYLSFRDLLRRSPEARARYEVAKMKLVETHQNDRRAYTEGKTAVVLELIDDFG